MSSCNVVASASRASRAFVLLAAVAVCAAHEARAQQPAAEQGPEARDPGPSPVEAMGKARNTFEYGDYATAARMLQGLIDKARFESPALRAEAYRLLGISLFYLGRRGEAYSAFLELLYLEPETELDPFYVSPGIVSLFDQVKKDSERQLAPIRAQHKAEQEARRKGAEEEAARRRQHELEEQQKRLFSMQPAVEKRVVQREFWVTVLPFGVGQLQNGDRTLGIGLATAQVVAGAASAGSALLIEELRDQSSGKFDPKPYQLANRLAVVKWVGAALFYALWAGGAVHAALRYQPEQQLPDRLVQQPSP